MKYFSIFLVFLFPVVANAQYWVSGYNSVQSPNASSACSEISNTYSWFVSGGAGDVVGSGSSTGACCINSGNDNQCQFVVYVRCEDAQDCEELLLDDTPPPPPPPDCTVSENEPEVIQDFFYENKTLDDIALDAPDSYCDGAGGVGGCNFALHGLSACIGIDGGVNCAGSYKKTGTCSITQSTPSIVDKNNAKNAPSHDTSGSPVRNDLTKFGNCGQFNGETHCFPLSEAKQSGKDLLIAEDISQNGASSAKSNSGQEIPASTLQSLNKVTVIVAGVNAYAGGGNGQNAIVYDAQANNSAPVSTNFDNGSQVSGNGVGGDAGGASTADGVASGDGATTGGGSVLNGDGSTSGGGSTTTTTTTINNDGTTTTTTIINNPPPTSGGQDLGTTNDLLKDMLEEEKSKGVVSESADCSVQPTCTGDDNNCAVVRQLWLNQCQGRDSVQNTINEYNANPFPDSNTGNFIQEFDLSSILDNLLPAPINSACPASDVVNFNIMGNQSTLEVDYSGYCEFSNMIRPFVLAIGALLSSIIVIGAFKGD